MRFTRGRTESAELIIFLSLERYTTELFRNSFEDEWNFASERSSIQPRAPFHALGRIRPPDRFLGKAGVVASILVGTILASESEEEKESSDKDRSHPDVMFLVSERTFGWPNLMRPDRAQAIRL